MGIMKEYAHSAVWAYRHIAGKFEVAEIEIIGRFLSSQSVCFDVGAHGGSWSRGLARLIPSGHVYGFEALPYYSRVLRRTMKLLGQRNITIINRAVTEKGDPVQMVAADAVGSRLTGKTHIRAGEEEVNSTVDVQGVTLDGFWEELGKPKVDFVKCDIEGFELFALRGGRRMIESCRPLFFNELNKEWCTRYGYEPEDVFEFFAGFGYQPYYAEGGSALIPADREAHVNRDVLFVPSAQEIPRGLLDA